MDGRKHFISTYEPIQPMLLKNKEFFSANQHFSMKKNLTKNFTDVGRTKLHNFNLLPYANAEI